MKIYLRLCEIACGDFVISNKLTYAIFSDVRLNSKNMMTNDTVIILLLLKCGLYIYL